MPYTLHIEKKLVVLNNQNNKMLEFLDEALKKEGLGEGSGLLPGLQRDQAGWWARLIAKPLEKITQKSFGSQTRELPLLILSIDPPAKMLREAYIDFLNELLLQEKFTSKQTENSFIESTFVLMREILIRFASIALCTDMNAERDGDKILKVLANFVTEINATELLKSKPLVGKSKLSDFNKHFATTHHVWVQCLQDMVDVLKNLRANMAAISQVLDYLNGVKLTLVRQLIAIMDPFQVEDNLSENWLRLTLHACETKVIANSNIKAINKSSHVAHSSWESMSLSPEQMQIVDCFNEELKPRTLEFYTKLNENNLLLKIIHHIDQLFTVSGWMTIMLGVIDMEQLTKRLEEHAKSTNALLSLKPNDELLNDKPISTGLTKYNAATGVGLHNLALKASRGLANLQNPELQETLMGCISHSLDELAKLQKKLDFIIVDVNYSKNFVASTKKIPASPIKSSSKSRFFSDVNTSSENSDYGESLLLMFNLIIRQVEELEQEQKFEEAANKLSHIIEFGNKFLPVYKTTLLWRANLRLESDNDDIALKALSDVSKLQLFVNNRAYELQEKLSKLEMKLKR